MVTTKAETKDFLVQVIVIIGVVGTAATVGFYLVDQQQDNIWEQEQAFYDSNKQKLYYNATEIKGMTKYQDNLLISADVNNIKFEYGGYIWKCNLSEVDPHDVRTTLNISKRKADLVLHGGL